MKLWQHGKPETQGQAETWSANLGQALRAGLGELCGCAAQHAYGRREGFSFVKAPCPACLSVMAAWPVRGANGWARWSTAGGPANSSAPSPDLPCPVTPDDPSNGSVVDLGWAA